MQQGNDNALRTRVYIDGYNLYYGCLRNSADKWLDVRALIERILPSILFEQNGEPARFAFQAPAVKYFTASILTAFARSDDSVSCQYHYHTALCAHLGGALEIIKGYHDAKPARAHVWQEGKAARECKMIEIWKLEEKQSDVAFALNAFSDAVRNEVDQVIAVTNDSDFAPAMKMIRQHTQAVVGDSAQKQGRTQAIVMVSAPRSPHPHLRGSETRQAERRCRAQVAEPTLRPPWRTHPDHDVRIY